MAEERLFAEDPNKVIHNPMFVSASLPIEKDNEGLLTKDPREKSIVEYCKNKNYYLEYKKIPDFYGEFWFRMTISNGDILQFRRDAGHSSCGVDELGRFSYSSRYFTLEDQVQLLSLYMVMKHNRFTFSSTVPEFGGSWEEALSKVGFKNVAILPRPHLKSCKDFKIWVFIDE